MAMDGGRRNPAATLWVFIPGEGGIMPATHGSILSEMLQWGGNLDHKMMRGDALISRSRSKAASWFLEADPAMAGDVLLMADHDLSWEPGDLSLLARRALEYNAVVGGIYSKRAFGAGPSVKVSREVRGDFRMGDDEVLPCEYVGAGFMAIPRTVIAAVAATLPKTYDGFWPLFLPMMALDRDGDMAYLPDDWSFCDRARGAGYRVLASTYPLLTQEAPYGYRVQDTGLALPETERMTLHFGDPSPVEQEAVRA